MPVTSYHTLRGRIRGQSSGGTRTEYLPDGLGSVVGTASSGAGQASYRHKPYGDRLSKSGSGADPRFLWVGTWGYRDYSLSHAERYVRARHCSSRTGRWTSVDPLWPQESAYGYVNGRPTVGVDPSGMEKIDLYVGNRPPNVHLDSQGRRPGMPIKPPYVYLGEVFAKWLGKASSLYNATRAFEHWADGTGTDLTIPVNYMLVSTGSKFVKRNCRSVLGQVFEFVEGLKNGSYSINTRSALIADIPLSDSIDWNLAVGGHSYWVEGRAVICNGNYRVRFEFHIKDRYNFDPGPTPKSWVVSNYFALSQASGSAKEYVSSGKYVAVFEWKKGKRPSNECVPNISGFIEERRRVLRDLAITNSGGVPDYSWIDYVVPAETIG